MAIGSATGDNRAQQAAEQAIASKLLDVSIDGAQSILFNVTGGLDMTLHEVNELAEIIARDRSPRERQHHLRRSDRSQHGRRVACDRDRHRV